MKRRSWLWFIASAFLAVMAGAVAILALSQAAGRETQVVSPPGHAVVVARQPLAANSIIRPDNVVVEERQDSTSGAAVRVQDVLGQVTLRPLAQGEVVLMQDVAAIGLTSQVTGTRDLPMLLGDNQIAVALPANDTLSQWGAVMPGDHIDVLFTLDIVLETQLPVEMEGEEEPPPQVERDQSLDNVSVLTLQNLEVLQIIQEPAAQTPEQNANQQQAQPVIQKRALVLKISPQDAVILKYVRDSVGKIDLALRSPTNGTLFDVDPVNINYLVMRYGITLPEPLE